MRMLGVVALGLALSGCVTSASAACVTPADMQALYKKIALIIRRQNRMARNSFQAFLLATVLSLATHSTVDAADIQNTDNKLCAFGLDGPITKGDADRLTAAISSSHINQYNERTSSVCLKSNGGSYVEGLKIAELVYNRGLSTVIEYGSECYSACAIIFMAGVASAREGPMRKLSVGGVLDFTRPISPCRTKNTQRKKWRPLLKACEQQFLLLFS